MGKKYTHRKRKHTHRKRKSITRKKSKTMKRRQKRGGVLNRIVTYKNDLPTN